MEIITGVERRRRWRPEQKLRILAELEEPGARFIDVARRHDVSRGLLWQWREARRRGHLAAEAPAFVPLRVVAAERPAPEMPETASPRSAALLAPDDRIEIVLADGTTVRVAERINTTTLRRVLAAVRG